MTGRRACPSLAPAGLGRRLPGHLQHRDDQCGRTARLAGRLNQAHGGGRRRLINLHTDIGVSGDPGHPGGFKVEHRQRRLAAIKLRQHKRCNRVPMATIDAPNTLTKRRMGRKPLSRRHNANQHQMTEAAQIGMTAQGIAANRVPGKHRRRSFLCLTEMSVLRLRRQAPPKSGDFAQRATQAITTARELDRLRVGKKLALTAHARLDCPGRENSQGADTCQDAAHQRHRDGEHREQSVWAGLGRATSRPRKQRIPQLRHQIQPVIEPDQPGIEPHIAVDDMRDLVGHHALQLIAGESLERTTAGNHH